MKMQTSNVNSREIVLSLLMEIYGEKEFSHILLRQVLDKYDYLPSGEKAFIKRLTEGTLERTLELDYILDQFSTVKVDKMKPLIRSLLRMSVYQLLYMDKVPDSAACNEAVKLAVNHRFSSLKGYVNGVLRTIARQKVKISYPQKEKDFVGHLSVLYSMPAWLVEHFIEQYGGEMAERLLAELLKERPVTIRVNEDISSTKKEELKMAWSQQKIKVLQHPYLSYAYICENTDSIASMAGFAEGLVGVQDVSSMLVTETAGIKKGMNVMDVCAAPGGKAIHAALKMKETGRVIARDISAAKVRLIDENAVRQKVGNLETEVWDATCFDETKEEWADVLFCDLPCSGIGIMGRKRDIKYRLQAESLEKMAELQRRIILSCWRYVKPGGIMMYSTCTINIEENQKQIEWITNTLPFETAMKEEKLPEALKVEEKRWGLQLLPGIHETDGFFFARLRRKE